MKNKDQTIYNLLSEDNGLLTYRPSLRPICKSINSTILLTQILYWDKIKKGKFFKFKQPCTHEWYKEGDSWCEELGFSRDEFDTALKNIAIKKTQKNKNTKTVINSIIWYNTDINRVTWYTVNKIALRKSALPLYEKTEIPLYESSSSNDSIYTENTIQRLHTNSLSKDKRTKELCANNSLGPLEIFNYSSKTKNILKLWNKLGGKIHKRRNAKTPEKIESMIQELLHQGRNPFAALPKKEIKKLSTKKFTVKEIKRCMKFYTNDLGKQIDHIYFHDFILFRKNGKVSLRDNSPLAETFILLPEKLSSTKRSKYLKKELSHLRPKETISNVVFIRASIYLKKLEKKYEVHEGASIGYHGRIPRVFVEYVKEKCSNTEFKLSYISGKTFLDQFLTDALKRYQLQGV